MKNADAIIGVLNAFNTGDILIIVDRHADFQHLKRIQIDRKLVGVNLVYGGQKGWGAARADTIIACTKEYDKEWDFLLKDADSRVVWIKRFGDS